MLRVKCALEESFAEMKWTQQCRRFLLSAAFLLVTTVGTTVEAQNPYDTADDTAAGEQLFQRNCSSCHGGNATGGRGPNLRRRPYRNGNSDAQVHSIILFGLPGMPFNGLSDKSAWQVVAYLRSLSSGAPAVAGDSGQGRELFFGKADCGLCHMVNGTGGRQGPDLSWVGWRLGPDALHEAIVAPNADVAPRWWPAVVLTDAGEEVAGYVVDDDQFNIRLLDRDDALRAFRKQNLRRIDRQVDSLMPAFGELLSEDEITDLIAYLSRLSGTESSP